jgi:hypothetical protein
MWQNGSMILYKPNMKIEEFKSYTDRSFLPHCKMDFIHTMTETKEEDKPKNWIISSLFAVNVSYNHQ